MSKRKAPDTLTESDSDIQNKKQQVITKETKFQINDKFITILDTDRGVLAERSSLLQGLFESCKCQTDEVIIKLHLERPEKFSVLFHYLETGTKSEELVNYNTFASYINDVIYMGMDVLEQHMLEMLHSAIHTSKADLIDFSQSSPSYDFMENFMSKCEENRNFDKCELLLNWVRFVNTIDVSQVDTLVSNIDFRKIELCNLKYLLEIYPESFDVIVPSSVLLSCHLENRVKCIGCRKMVLEAAIGKDPCYKDYGPGRCFQDGFHKV